MNIYVLNTSLNRVGIVDVFSSVIWTNRYYSCGDFELYLRATPNLLNILQKDYYLIREGHESNAMIIEAIQLSTDAENGNYLTVKGRCLKSILYRRIIWDMTTVSGTVEACIATLLDNNAISPTDVKRKILNLFNVNEYKTSINMQAQYTGNNLGETIEALCTQYEIGWDIKLDLENKKFSFYLYAGKDRTFRQKENSAVIFSDEYENLLTTTYTLDKSEYSNVAKVAGEGEGAARKNVTVGNESGLDRYELFVDARDLSQNSGDTQITDAEYNAQLQARGERDLAEKIVKVNIEGEVEANYTYRLNEDYFLGDIVEIRNEYGIAGVSRITEIIESEDDSGMYTIPTFSAYTLKEG